MINTLITSFKIEMTYMVNSTIYSIKQIPVIKHLITDDIYAGNPLKFIPAVLSVLFNIGKSLIKSFLLYFFIIFIPALFVSLVSMNDDINAYLHIFTFVTLASCLLNDSFFKPTRGKYYSLVYLKMNAKEYAISQYIFKVVIHLVVNAPLLFVLGLLSSLKISLILLTFLLYIEAKILSIYYNLIVFERTNTLKEQTIYNKLELIPLILLISVAYILPFIGYSINNTIFSIILVILTILSIFALRKIITFQKYTDFFKNILSIANLNTGKILTSTQKIRREALDSIEYSEDQISSKKGYAFFNELFIKRHEKILSDSICKQSIVLVIIIIVSLVGTLLFKDVKESINSMVLNFLPYFIIIMYFLNRGKNLTCAMFMNCDHSMLTYRFYRTPKVILGVFKQRLKTLIKYNLIPASILGVGLSMLLFVSGGTNTPLNYLIVTTSIVFMSIFFSIHYMVLYYFLQPYNIATEVKSKTYSIVEGFTYLVCYCMTDYKLPTFQFGLACIVFCVIYSVISLVMVYYIAPKTFKLRQ